MRTRIATLIFVTLNAASFACGGGLDSDPMVEDSKFAFRIHPLECGSLGIGSSVELRLEVDGKREYCSTHDTGDGRAVGSCTYVEVEDDSNLRLVFYLRIYDTREVDYFREVDLAVASHTIDLSTMDGDKYQLKFEATDYDLSMDDDNDGMSNFDEICAGRDPVVDEN